MRNCMIKLINLTTHRALHLVKDDTFKLWLIVFVQLYADAFLRKIKRVDIGKKRRIKVHSKQIKIVVFVLRGIRIRRPIGCGHRIHKRV